MERLSVSCVILFFLAASAIAGNQNVNDPNTITKMFRTNNGMIGVASIAGVTSRNGRVSSVSSVKFYPATGPQDMTYFFPDVKSGEKLPEPISFSKEENGRITSGSIKYGPGSVSVSSSARSALPEGYSSSKFGKPLSDSKQAFDDMFFPYPLSTFNSRSYDPWFPNDLAFRQPPLPKFDSVRRGWPYPSFSPFTFW